MTIFRPILPDSAEGLSAKDSETLMSVLSEDDQVPLPFELKFAKILIRELSNFRKETIVDESPEFHLSMLLRILYVAYIPFSHSNIRLLTRIYLAYTYNNLKRSPKDRMPAKCGYYRIAGERIFNAMLDTAKKFYIVHKAKINPNAPMDYTKVRQALNAELHVVIAMKCSSTLVRPPELTLESFSERLKNRVPIFKKDECGHYFPALTDQKFEEFEDL